MCWPLELFFLCLFVAVPQKHMIPEECSMTCKAVCGVSNYLGTGGLFGIVQNKIQQNLKNIYQNTSFGKWGTYWLLWKLCVHVLVKVHICVYACGALGQPWGWLLGCGLPFFDRVSMAWSSLIKLGCLTSEPQGPSSVVPSVAYKCVPAFWAFLMWA